MIKSNKSWTFHRSSDVLCPTFERKSRVGVRSGLAWRSIASRRCPNASRLLHMSPWSQGVRRQIDSTLQENQEMCVAKPMINLDLGQFIRALCDATAQQARAIIKLFWFQMLPDVISIAFLDKFMVYFHLLTFLAACMCIIYIYHSLSLSLSLWHLLAAQ